MKKLNVLMVCGLLGMMLSACSDNSYVPANQPLLNQTSYPNGYNPYVNQYTNGVNPIYPNNAYPAVQPNLMYPNLLNPGCINNPLYAQNPALFYARLNINPNPFLWNLRSSNCVPMNVLPYTQNNCACSSRQNNCNSCSDVLDRIRADQKSRAATTPKVKIIDCGKCSTRDSSTTASTTSSRSSRSSIDDDADEESPSKNKLALSIHKDTARALYERLARKASVSTDPKAKITTRTGDSYTCTMADDGAVNENYNCYFVIDVKTGEVLSWKKSAGTLDVPVVSGKSISVGNLEVGTGKLSPNQAVLTYDGESAKTIYKNLKATDKDGIKMGEGLACSKDKCTINLSVDTGTALAPVL